jgi:uncharacterized membrane-anchored protein YhcB (DUF1043 family)
MGTAKPPSPTANSSPIRAASKLTGLSLVQGLLRIAPGLPAAAVAGLVILFFAWSCEHRARQRELTEAQQVKKQAAEQISRLEQQASSAVRDARQSAQAANQLESQRQQLAHEADGLRESLEALRRQESARDNALANLTTEEVVKRVAARMQEQGMGNREQGTEQRTLTPLTRPAPADESAVAGHPLPQGGEGKSLSAGEGTTTAGGEGTGQEPSAHLGTSPSAHAATSPSAHLPTSPSAHLPTPPPAALALSDQGVRKVESAFLELDSCRQQSQVMAQQVSNCEERAKVDSTLESQQAQTIAKLNAALADKDQVLARSAAAYRAELKAARGSWQTRLYHAVGIFAGGFIAGVLVR